MNTVFYDEETKSFSIRSVMVSSKVVRAELDRAVEITQRFHSEWDEGIQTEHPLTQYTVSRNSSFAVGFACLKTALAVVGV